MSEKPNIQVIMPSEPGQPVKVRDHVTPEDERFASPPPPFEISIPPDQWTEMVARARAGDFDLDKDETGEAKAVGWVAELQIGGMSRRQARQAQAELMVWAEENRFRWNNTWISVLCGLGQKLRLR